MNTRRYIWIASALSAILLSVPWLVPGTGFLALFALVPLLFAEAAMTDTGYRHSFLAYYSCFVLWNALTTFWVCNATVAGGVFAILANALQMAVIFAVFRFSRKKLGGPVPYIFLAVMWITWEHWYFDTQISWPWLVLGHAFARSTGWIQWYEFTGTLGGSLWVWFSNLAIFGLLSSLSGGSWKSFNRVARVCSVLGTVLILALPAAASFVIGCKYEEKCEDTLDVVIGQPNFDPYEKFESMDQATQTGILLDLYSGAVPDTASKCLFIAPETFTGDVFLNDVTQGYTWQEFNRFLQRYPNSGILFGASAYRVSYTRCAPTRLARKYGNGWIESFNSALLTDASGRTDVYHKSKLVVGTELTPYPAVFVPLEKLLCRLFGMYSLMGHCQGQKEISVLEYAGLPIGCAVCYESVYGEYCTGFVKKGARALAVITNDAWWGNTPGYKQHCSYSCLRAIELRRDIARCGNTGISGIIDQKGNFVSKTSWWIRDTLSGSVNLTSGETFFTRNGDIVGRVCSLLFLLLLALLFVRTLLLKPHKK